MADEPLTLSQILFKNSTKPFDETFVINSVREFLEGIEKYSVEKKLSPFELSIERLKDPLDFPIWLGKHQGIKIKEEPKEVTADATS